MKRVAILGCTGSIGSSALSVIRRFPDDFTVSLLANRSADLSLLQKEFSSARLFTKDLAKDKVFLSRPETYFDSDIVINGIDGISGLFPSYAVLQAGKILATANKESLVCAGSLLNHLATKTNGKIYPLDSEHSAVWQLLAGNKIENVKKIILTASGGAFRDYTEEQLVSATPEQALQHPNWKMGKKVTVDCATLVNKGMELIEAKHLFHTENVTAVQHRESIVHAIVEMVDNSYLAAMSMPDMVLPIQYALFYPNRKSSSLPEMDLHALTLHFAPIDEKRFPGYALCREASKRGDVGGTVLNATDEIMVAAFLRKGCTFNDISRGIEKALGKFQTREDFSDIQDVFLMDREVREYILSEFGLYYR